VERKCSKPARAEPRRNCSRATTPSNGCGSTYAGVAQIERSNWC